MLPMRKKNPTSKPAKIIHSATPQSTTELHRRRKNTERVVEVIGSRTGAEWKNGNRVARTATSLFIRGLAQGGEAATRRGFRVE
jgi:hypothetical protein